ncbi:phosphoribosylamine-glycine ligase [Heterostelium album PN500]|uniref:Phosphoribosylformylglycinamidine cyclo-ligase n=1 Tax=Heterostelium pallidum (strain ATCC 26659 / Pp 5 / PN500) TaxID=670386 RepID=D3BJB3_HETP5|nr:phosphoribosylamine-glycine ligase [Heterostelium album PN500]EFA77993.1 phosphoribosylamine-glycine ligase [Heterostelium album PN500]|eukprot:XP_020430121.1 phosphoribosylamine-glycine ligase [Heterostelium album PN500]
MSKKVIVIGSGSREHAIAWKLLESSKVEQVYMVPGNGSASTSGDRIINLSDVAVTAEAVGDAANRLGVDLVIVGPEVPLVDGIANGLRRRGIRVFGPSQKAAEIEGSKVFCKDFMARHNIPTARYKSFVGAAQYDAATQYVEQADFNVVVKASGCAAGKGVLIPANKEEAKLAVKRVLVDREFGAAGDEVVIEEFLDGEEASVMAFSDGYSVVLMPAAQDHKRIFDDDKGPNTGGMGAYAPAPFVTDRSIASRTGFGPTMDRVLDTVIKPTVDGMRREGRPFVGVLFAGLMVSPSGVINVLEFNCRMGDPETQVVLPLLDTELIAVVDACCDGALDSIKVNWKQAYAVTIVSASEGYPDSYPKGREIHGLNNAKFSDEAMIFQAGTTVVDGKLVTSGGRVLSATSVNSELETAIQLAYKANDTIDFQGRQFRRDIGRKAQRYLASQKNSKSVSYSESGVDIERGDAVVDNIAPLAKATTRKGCVSDLGGFGALFDTKAAGFVDPILVSGTDGVGTKLKIAQEIGIHDNIGVDLVAMCVNDVLVQGAEPLFFLDYFATGRIHVDVATQVIGGIAKGCSGSGCALIGGETAEMPGMYRDGEYDLAGFAVGAVERTQMLPRNIKPGDVLLGLASSGVHSNGYSLVRYLVEKKSGLVNANGSVYDLPAPFESSKTLGQALLTPTRLYVLSCLAAIKAGGINGLAHITGGGITENLPRVLPDGMNATVKLNSWEILPVFQWLNNIGKMEQFELLRTFNCGLGMIVIVDANRVESITEILKQHNETVYQIGTITASTETNSKPKVIYQ